jgi:hypothetical protein
VRVHGVAAQSNELNRGPPELVQHFRSVIGGVHIDAEALLDPKLIWFAYITRLSQWGGGNLLVQMIFYLPSGAKGKGGGVGTLCVAVVSASGYC